MRAQQLYLSSWSAMRIGEELGIARATVHRWIERYGWAELREMQERLEKEAGELVLRLTQAASSSGDPQQAYAAVRAAELTGLRTQVEMGPRPDEVAEALLDVIAADPELGPLVRRKRKSVLAAVATEVSRLSGRSAAL